MLVAAFLGGAIYAEWTPQRLLAYAGWHAEHVTVSGAPTGCDDTSWLSEQAIGSAQAYYELSPEGPDTYYANNIADGNLDTAWAQPFPRPGHAAEIDLQLTRTSHVRLVCLQRGYTKNYTSFSRNERLRTVVVQFPRTRCHAVTANLPDVLDDSKVSFATFASIPVDCPTDDVRIVVVRTWPATDGSHDVAISEARVFAS